MDENINLIEGLRAHIRELEEKIVALRMSRRVLMNLLDCLENEIHKELLQVENQNRKLQKSNCHYARTIRQQNSLIAKLEEKIRLFSNLT
ncbi:translation initiation factor 2 [Pelosinus sp. sgz500959]|uniref:translation initiation factor 2 n=1 Tax=Pelosinus sp. sgz500959 TaxID=3242472 RepID=UPI00366D5EDA